MSLRSPLYQLSYVPIFPALQWHRAGTRGGDKEMKRLGRQPELNRNRLGYILPGSDRVRQVARLSGLSALACKKKCL